MNKRKFLVFWCLLLLASSLFWEAGQSFAAPDAAKKDAILQRKLLRSQMNALRQTAAQNTATVTATPAAGIMAVPVQGGTPNYFGPEPNWAYSPQPQLDLLGNPIPGTGIRKFVDPLAGLTSAGANGLLTPGGDPLGQYIPVALADPTAFLGSDYYEIAVIQYTEKMHSDLNPTTLRGYVQLETPFNAATSKHIALNYPNGTPILDSGANQVYAYDYPHYLGPIIVAQKNVPVRVKFTNYLPKGAGGDLFLPVDTTEMGAGMGPMGMMTTPGWPMNYLQNRATLHLHGGLTPWISDGTPHQWTTPAGDNTDYPQGVSVSNVPDMPDPGPGSLTFFYSNQQSARLMFYHDHAYGITRLNVYAGEAAGYLLTDAVEQDLVTRGVLPAVQIPLVIQDKTFISPSTVLTTDPTWPFPVDAALSDLWYPHVYMPNQNPNAIDGINPVGRWDYGPWFWPPWPATNGPITLGDGTVVPGVPDLSMTMEAFQDTPVVNGTVYPYLDVQPQAYRFRILNAANDRFLNLQLYEVSSIVSGITITSGGSGYKTIPMVSITPAVGDTTGKGASALATIDPVTGAVTAIDLVTVGSGYTLPPVVTVAPAPAGGVTATATASIYTGLTEVGMVPAFPGADSFPVDWTPQTLGQPGDILDGRYGGVPDPAKIGPSIIQIGTEGGFLPTPVVFNNIPIGYDRDTKSITVLNVKEHNLFLGTAERADVVIDFSAFRGKTLVLYNDAPAAVPAADNRLDYYTGHPDLTDVGGTVPTLPGYGPNTRTLMQIRVADVAPAPAFDLAKLNDEFATTATHQSVFVRGQDPIIVPQEGYNSAYNASFPSGTSAYERIQSLSLTFNPLDLSTPAPADQVATPVTIINSPKAIAEEFEDAYGRMSAFLGVEVPFTNGMNQTTIFYGYKDPSSELIDNNDTAIPIGTAGDGTQIWKVTHNGVDSHTVHFHLFNVQLINRVDWAGVVKPPEPNELGWKETVRMNPLEDCIVALRPVAPTLPFPVPDSIRPLDPTMPIGDVMGFKNVDTSGNPVTVTNQLVNFGWEFVWHCHILSHEEMDMMRAITFVVKPEMPSGLAASPSGKNILLTWQDNSASATSFNIQRATDAGFTTGVTNFNTPKLANPQTFMDTTVKNNITYYYKVQATKDVGAGVLFAGYPSEISTSAWTAPVSSVVVPVLPAAPSNVQVTAFRFNNNNDRATVTWTDNSNNETGFRIQRATNASFTGNSVNTSTVNTANITTFTTGNLSRNTNYYFRVQSFNAAGPSAWVNANTFPVLTP
jgi:FtsP/CotA-like multicopper oxidase with cupredoxin domain